MRLTTIAAARPGLPLNPSIDDLGPGLNVVVGPNGCGKSTMQRLARDLLAAAPAAQSESDAPIAGSIGIAHGKDAFRLVRCVRDGHPETTAVVARGAAIARWSPGASAEAEALVRFVDAGNLHQAEELARLAAAMAALATNSKQDTDGAGPFAQSNWEIVTRTLRQQHEAAQLRAGATLRVQVRRQRALHTRRRWLDDQIHRQLETIRSLDQDWQAAQSDLRIAEARPVQHAPTLPNRLTNGIIPHAELSELGRRAAALQEVVHDLAQQRMRHTRMMATGLHSASCPTHEVRDRLDRCEVEVLHQLHVVNRRLVQLQSPQIGACPQCGDTCPTCGSHKPLQEVPHRVESAVSEASTPQPHRKNLQQRANELRERLFAARDALNDLFRRRQRLDTIRRAAALDPTLDAHRYAAAELEQLLWDILQYRRVESPAPAFVASASHVPAVDVFALASDSFRRLTQDRYRALHWNADEQRLLALPAEGRPARLSALSRGTNEQAALALRLSLLKSLAAVGRCEPALWDEPLADTDEGRLQIAAAELASAAESGVQLIILTCRDRVASLLASHGARVHRLGESSASESSPRIAQSTAERTSLGPRVEVDAPVCDGASDGSDDSVKQSHAIEASLESDEPVGVDAFVDEGPMIRVHPSEPFWLRLDSPLTQVPSLGFQFARRLRALGLNDVRDLIQFDPGLKLALLGELQITAGQIQLWQAEARLLIGVSDLTARDAQILVSCGIMRPEDLAQADTEELVLRLDRLRGGRNDWHPGLAASPRRETIARWIRSARGRLVDDIERQVTAAPPSRVQAITFSDSPHDHRPEHLQFVTQPQLEQAQQQPDGPRFRLHLDSPVVDAPSIGLKTAKLLRRAGIVTVADLLDCDPDRAAARMRHRRITTDVIRVWQRQAVLMCTVPELRCADAAVLVACGIASPLDLSRISPSALGAMLMPLLSSAEGQRLLRGARAPSVEEITRWTETVEETRVRRAA